MNKAEKIALLSKVLGGETEQLRTVRAKRGRPYTSEQRADQKAYMDSWGDKKHTDEEVAVFFGRHDKSQVPGTTFYRLPNGMDLSF